MSPRFWRLVACGLIGLLALVSGHGERCVRTGDYRIIYEIDNGALLVLVLTVGRRCEVYHRGQPWVFTAQAVRLRLLPVNRRAPEHQPPQGPGPDIGRVLRPSRSGHH